MIIAMIILEIRSLPPVAYIISFLFQLLEEQREQLKNEKIQLAKNQELLRRRAQLLTCKNSNASTTLDRLSTASSHELIDSSVNIAKTSPSSSMVMKKESSPTTTPTPNRLLSVVVDIPKNENVNRSPPALQTNCKKIDQRYRGDEVVKQTVTTILERPIRPSSQCSTSTVSAAEMGKTNKL